MKIEQKKSESTNGSKTKIFFENLDGLRFLCFLSVFLFHSFYTEYDWVESNRVYKFIVQYLFSNGNLGVNFFFVISGFLITFLLLKEKEVNGQINLKNFWLRRILRIWPLFYFCVFFGFIIFPYLKLYFGQEPNETANWVYYVSFLNNFDFIKNGLPDASILGVLWSVAIEEQFYFVWPIILYILPKNKYWIAFITVLLGCIIFRAIYINDYIVLEHHTLSCVGDLVVGAMGAWLINEKKRFRSFIENMSKEQILILYVLMVVIFLYRKDLLMSNAIIRTVERPMVAVVILFIILEQCFSKNSLFKMKDFKLMSKFGVISYGLYCLQFVGILITLTIARAMELDYHTWQVVFLEMPVSLILTIILAQLSYRFYEKPFLKLKERFGYFSK